MYREQELFRLNLLRIIRERNLTQKAFARWSQMEESEISRIVNHHIPLTTERLSHICMRTGLEANEFYREDIVVNKNHGYETVRLLTDAPIEKPKRTRTYRYEKLAYRFTEREFIAFKQSIYKQGYADGLRAKFRFSTDEVHMPHVAENEESM